MFFIILHLCLIHLGTYKSPLGVGSSGDLNPDKLIFASLIENENYELN